MIYPKRKVLAATGCTLAFCVGLILCPTPVAAQSIHGRLLDDETGVPLSNVTVTLVASAGDVVGKAFSDTTGVFVLDAPETGRYRIRARHIGYLETTSPPIDVVADEVVEVEVRMSADAIPLAPLTVVSERAALVLDSRLERWGYYARRERYGKSGFAHFLEHDEIQRRDSWSLAGVLRTVPGVRIYSTGGRTFTIAGRRGCPVTLYLDGMRIQEMTSGDIPIGELVLPSQVVVWTGVPAR
jgi:hypothetical protein